MNRPLINIITRGYRPQLFEKCRETIVNQTYKNVRHIVTYEDDIVGGFLDDFDVVKVRVNKRPKDPNLWWSRNYHVSKESWIEPDWEWLDSKFVNEQIELELPVEPVKYYGEENKNLWNKTTDYSVRVNEPHFPPCFYCKVAEREVKDGWVMYIDDDDFLKDNECLEYIVEQITKFDEDTLHIYNSDNLYYKRIGYLEKYKKLWNTMKHHGSPFIYSAIGANIVFNTKYLEYTQWDGWSAGDYRTAKALEQVTKRRNFIDKEILVILGSGATNA